MTAAKAKRAILVGGHSGGAGKRWELVGERLLGGDEPVKLVPLSEVFFFSGSSSSGVSSSAGVAAVLDDGLGRHADFIRSSRCHEIRFVVLKLMNRNDLTGTWRLLERETRFSQLVAAILNMLEKENPDLIIFEVTPHEYVDYAIWALAEWIGIRVLFFQPSPIAPAMFARTSLDTFVVPREAAVAQSGFADHLKQIAGERLERLANGVDPRYMEVQRGRDISVARPGHRWVTARAVFSWVFRERFPESVDLSGHRYTFGFVTRIVKIFLTRSLQRSLRLRALSLGEGAGHPGKYGVFALHYEPERTSLPDGLPIDFQGNAIVLARSLLPSSRRLLVKEHYSQQTAALRGFLGRSPDFYDFVESLPSTHFVSTTLRLSDLVLGAECVFTLTGTIAVEAVLRGIPVVYFGHPWWAGLPGTLKFSDVEDFSEVVKAKMPSPEEAFSHLLNSVLHEMIPGAPFGSAEIVEAGFLPQGFEQAVVSSITFCIQNVFRGSD